jgi:hypothetical protein
MTDYIPKLNSTIKHERASAREEKIFGNTKIATTKIKY